jgi:large subunit ribosomal protein L30
MAPKNANATKTLTVRLVRSVIGCIEGQRLSVRALGLGKVGSSRTLQDNPTVRGLIAKVHHLVEVQES